MYYNVANNTYWMHYPLGFPNEFSIQDVWVDPLTYGGPGENRHRVYVNVTFQKQTISAPGNGFLNGPAFGGRIWEKNDALNDPSTWDFRIGLYDVSNTDAVNYSYEEFGINELVSITVNGNPTGTGAPGMNNISLAPSSQIWYSVNNEYWVNISLVNELYLNGVPGPLFIPANQICVANVHVNASSVYSDIDGSYPFGRPFVGPGQANEFCVWGNSSIVAPMFMPPPLNGTIAAGVWGSDFTEVTLPGTETTAVDWWGSVPVGLGEGSYWTVITIKIETY
jgi:hypothetical protein